MILVYPLTNAVFQSSIDVSIHANRKSLCTSFECCVRSCITVAIYEGIVVLVLLCLNDTSLFTIDTPLVPWPRKESCTGSASTVWGRVTRADGVPLSDANCWGTRTELEGTWPRNLTLTDRGELVGKLQIINDDAETKFVTIRMYCSERRVGEETIQFVSFYLHALLEAS